MFDKESLIEELKTKTKTKIGEENGISRHQVYRLEKKLGIVKEDYTPQYRNKDFLIGMVNKYGTLSEVARQLNVDESTISNWSVHYGIKPKPRRNLKLDENYFEKINDEHKAYWLGYLMADGSMNKECTKITLNISTNDEHILLILKNDTSSDSTIKRSENNGFSYSRLTLDSMLMCKNLIYHGIVPKKSGKEILPDTIPKNLIRHFIRGYMDGDGSVVTYDKGNSAIRLDFAGMSYNIFYSIHEHLLEQKIIDSQISIYKENNSRCKHLNYCCKNALKVLDYLYKDSTIFLERKYLKYISKGPAL